MKKKCRTCGESFDIYFKLNGIAFDICNRINCLKCVPFNSRNQRHIEKNKICIDCKITYPNTIEYFNARTNSRVLCSYCKICTRIRSKKWADNKKLNAIKIYGNHKCYLCGYDKCIDALNFHHVDPKFKESQIYSIAIDKLSTEVKKCLLVCGNCHREIHIGLHPEILKIKASNNKLTKRNVKYFNECKREWMSYLGSKCTNCGYDKSVAAMDFHHKNDDQKEYNLSRKRGRSLNFVKRELNKCLLLCCNCHREEHAKLNSLKDKQSL